MGQSLKSEVRREKQIRLRRDFYWLQVPVGLLYMVPCDVYESMVIPPIFLFFQWIPLGEVHFFLCPNKERNEPIP